MIGSNIMTFQLSALVGILAFFAASTGAVAQAPGPQPESRDALPTAQLPEPPAEQQSEFRFVKQGGTAELAKQFIADKGWSRGWDDEKRWGVFIGESELLSADPTGLALSMQTAQLRAKFQFAELMAAKIESGALSYSEKSPSDLTAIRGILESRETAEGGDPVASGIRKLLDSMPPGSDPAAQAAYRRGIVNASRTLAQAAMSGMTTVAAFVKTGSDMLEGKVSVVLVSTPRSRALADALLGRAGDHRGLLKGAPSVSLQKHVDGMTAEQLVYTTGTTYRRDERGNYCVLGFGVGSVKDGDTEGATDVALEMANSQIRMIAGELVIGSRMLASAAQRTGFRDGTAQSESFTSVQSQVGSLSKALRIPGIQDVDVKQVEHPVLGTLMVVIRSWDLGRAETAAWLRKQFEEQGGWRGGEGVEPRRPADGTDGQGEATPTRNPRRGVPSGSGGGGIDEE
jgi:hypothetical protein